MEQLYGACPNVKVTIGDVSIYQKFFIHEKSFCSAIWMETKVIDNDETFE